MIKGIHRAPAPTCGFGREVTAKDFRERIVWERHMAHVQRQQGHNAYADMHDLTRVLYEERLPATSARARYVLVHYEFWCEPVTNIWRAINRDGPGGILTMIAGPDRAAVRARARALWGHFNFDDEAQAFDSVFDDDVESYGEVIS